MAKNDYTIANNTEYLDDSSSSSSEDLDMGSYDEKELALEQLRFEECENEVSPILNEINIAVDQGEEEKLIKLFRNLKSKLSMITNAYMEHTDCAAIIKKVSKRYKHSSSDVVDIVKRLRSELRTRYQIGSVPKGFKPKKTSIISSNHQRYNDPTISNICKVEEQKVNDNNNFSTIEQNQDSSFNILISSDSEATSPHGRAQGTDRNGTISTSSIHDGGNSSQVVSSEDQLKQIELAKEEFEKEKEKKLSVIPKEVVKDFRKIGFGKWGKAYMPVIQLSPYDVEDGAIRNGYFRMLEKTKAQKRTPTRLVFWYGCTWENRCEAYSYLNPIKIIDYEIGKKEGLDKLSPVVEKKLAQGKPLTNKEDSYVQALTQMKNDLDLPPEKRIAWMSQFKESYETMFDPDSDIEIDADFEQEVIKKNKKKPKKRGRPPKLKINRTIHSDSEDELVERNSTIARGTAEIEVKPKPKPPGKKRGRKSNAEKEAERLAEIARQEAEAAAVKSPASPKYVFKSTDSDSDNTSSSDYDDDDYSDDDSFNNEACRTKSKYMKSTTVTSSSSSQQKKRRKKNHSKDEEVHLTKGGKRKSKAVESDDELDITTKEKKGIRLMVLCDETQKFISLNVKLNEKISNVKMKIECKKNIQTYQQCLLWKDSELDDNLKLADYAIERDSCLVLKKSVVKVTILNDETQKLIYLHAKLSDTVENLKKKIETKEKIPTNHQCLLWKDNELEDSQELSHYNVEKDSLLVLKTSVVKLVILNDKTQKIITLFVNLNDTVESLKRKVEQQENIPARFQCLLWRGNEVENNKKLLEYSIEKNSFLVLKQCISN